MSEPHRTRAFSLEMAASRDDRRAAEEFLPLLYSELRGLARSLLAKLPAGQTLQPTALVHEAYLRLVKNGDPGWEGRAHFFGAAARAMRQVLVDEARRKQCIKRGGGMSRISMDQVVLESRVPVDDMLALDEAFQLLERWDESAAKVAHLRLFAGMTLVEIVDVIGMPLRSVEREWAFARSFLADRLKDGSEGKT